MGPKAGQKREAVSPSNLHLVSSFSATSTYVPQTFEQQPAPTGREYLFTIPEFQMTASHVIEPAQKRQVVARGQSNTEGSQLPSWLFLWPSRLLTFTLTQVKHFNPPSVASATRKDSSHNIFGLSSLWGNIESYIS